MKNSEYSDVITFFYTFPFLMENYEYCNVYTPFYTFSFLVRNSEYSDCLYFLPYFPIFNEKF